MRKVVILLFLTILGKPFVFAQNLPIVKMGTSLGEIVLEIDTLHAPLTAGNFLKHIADGTYKNAVFYRVVRMNNQPGNDTKIEVIQGGLFDDDKIDKINPVKHETTKQTGLHHLNGTISMARNTPGTASVEFFICVGEQPALDFGGKRNPDGQGFAAFGRVLKGMGTVRKIQQQKDKDQYLLSPVKIDSIVILP